ncbi:MAG: NDP-hexose 2,3-dehydratase family protein [Wenzhouxiangella sp.]|jgi:oxidase EvaA|nr:NDP-hexose 2,3-dehydratase family protein [Wenzhouxiangella sp.]
MNDVVLAHDAKTARDFLSSTAEASCYSLRRIRMSAQEDWRLVDGALSHKTGGFFSVAGVRGKQTPDDEHLMLYQPQSALTGLILCRSQETVFVLLQARVEPGNTGVIQYGPTIQSTPANYLRLHGGRTTSYVDRFTEFRPGTRLLTHSMQLDLGCRYFQKSKTHHYLEVDELIDCAENMIWVSTDALSELLFDDNLLNADLRSLLAVFDWTSYLECTGKTDSIAADLALARTVGDRRLAPGSYELVPLDALAGWRINEDGIPMSAGCGVGIYEFSCTNREVKAWTQPLFEVERRGLVQLLLRSADDRIECLVSVAIEPGLSTDHALYPSYCRTPLREIDPAVQPDDGELIACIVQCDEGGRFYHNDSLYELRWASDTQHQGASQAWIGLSDLIALLRASNRASFQLRCAVSMLLPRMHQVFSRPGS